MISPFPRMRKRERTAMLINEAEVLEATHASLQVVLWHKETMMMMPMMMPMMMVMVMRDDDDDEER